MSRPVAPTVGPTDDLRFTGDLAVDLFAGVNGYFYGLAWRFAISRQRAAVCSFKRT
jgi:hypothetical protein